MVKVFISGLDTPYGHNLANILSQSFVGSRNEEVPEEETEEDPNAESPAPVIEKAPKEYYTVVGSFEASTSENLINHIPTKPATKPGKLIETGDRKKDQARREAINKIPIPNLKQSFVSQAVNGNDQTAIMNLMLESDVIIYTASGNPTVTQNLLDGN
jgi:adenylate kinase